MLNKSLVFKNITIISVANSAGRASSTPSRQRKASQKMMDSTESEQLLLRNKVLDPADDAKMAAVDTTVGEEVTVYPFDARSVEEKIVNCLARWILVDVESIPKSCLVAYSGYGSDSTKAFSYPFSSLIKSGYINCIKRNKGVVYVELTDCAVADGLLPNNLYAPNNTADLHSWICDLLDKWKIKGARSREMFEQLSDGKEHSTMSVLTHMRLSSISSKGYSTSLSQLRALGLIKPHSQKSANGDIQLSDICFR